MRFAWVFSGWLISRVSSDYNASVHARAGHPIKGKTGIRTGEVECSSTTWPGVFVDGGHWSPSATPVGTHAVLDSVLLQALGVQFDDMLRVQEPKPTASRSKGMWRVTLGCASISCQDSEGSKDVSCMYTRRKIVLYSVSPHRASEFLSIFNSKFGFWGCWSFVTSLPPLLKFTHCTDQTRERCLVLAMFWDSLHYFPNSFELSLSWSLSICK